MNSLGPRRTKNPQLKLFSFFLYFFFHSKSFCITDRHILTQSEVRYGERTKRRLNEAERCKKKLGLELIVTTHL